MTMTPDEEKIHMRQMAGVMVTHAVVARWWRPDIKVKCLWRARSYARRSLGWPR